LADVLDEISSTLSDLGGSEKICALIEKASSQKISIP
jgi:hypothetical protein